MKLVFAVGRNLDFNIIIYLLSIFCIMVSVTIDHDGYFSQTQKDLYLRNRDL